MSSVWAIVRRELQAYFVSPIAYAVIVVFLLIATFGFASSLSRYLTIPPFVLEERGFDLRSIVGRGLVMWAMIGLILTLPALSMRLFSEEKKTGTAELLMTSPLTTGQLVLGKYLGALAVLAIMLALTFGFPVVLEILASPDWGAFATSYVGLLLYGGVLLAVGVFASSLTENQIVALVVTYAIFLPLWAIEVLVGFVGRGLDDILASTSVNFGLRLMGLGLVNSHYLVLTVALVFTFLFLSVQVLDSTRWR